RKRITPSTLAKSKFSRISATWSAAGRGVASTVELLIAGPSAVPRDYGVAGGVHATGVPAPAKKRGPLTPGRKSLPGRQRAGPVRLDRSAGELGVVGRPVADAQPDPVGA